MFLQSLELFLKLCFKPTWPVRPGHLADQHYMKLPRGASGCERRSESLRRSLAHGQSISDSATCGFPNRQHHALGDIQEKTERISYYLRTQLIFWIFDWKPIHMAQSEVKWLSIKLTGRITNSSLAFARSLRLSYIQLAAPGRGKFQTKP